jgi:hypothetical protein
LRAGNQKKAHRRWRIAAAGGGEEGDGGGNGGEGLGIRGRKNGIGVKGRKASGWAGDLPSHGHASPASSRRRGATTRAGQRASKEARRRRGPWLTGGPG